MHISNTVSQKFPLIYLFAGLNSLLALYYVAIKRLDRAQIQSLIQTSNSHSRQPLTGTDLHNAVSVALLSIYVGIAIALALNIYLVLTRSVKIVKVLFILFFVFSIFGLVSAIAKVTIVGLLSNGFTFIITGLVLLQIQKASDAQAED